MGSFVLAVNRCQSEQEREYAAAVEALRADPSSAETIERLYGNAPTGIKPSLLLAAAQVGPAARAFLAAVASSPIGESRGADEAAERSRLRLTALDGLEILARAGDEQAWRDIERLASSADLGVQAGAVAALKFGGRDEALTRLRRQLPVNRFYLFDIRRPNVRDVPQIADPRRHLAGREVSSGERPHPEAVTTAPAAGRVHRRRGAPQIGRTDNG